MATATTTAPATVTELAQAAYSTRTWQPYRLTAPTAELAVVREDGTELWLVSFAGTEELDGTPRRWSEPAAELFRVRDGQLVTSYGERLGKSLRTVKAVAKRDAAQQAARQLEEQLRPAAVLACRALPARTSPEENGYHPVPAAERAALQLGDLVLAHGHGRWRVAVVTSVSRTGSVSYLFTTPTAIEEQGAHRVSLTGGTTKATENLYR